MTPLLSVVDAHKAYGGVQAARAVSFTIARGELVALIGPNGAGKSTTFGLIGGQVRPDRGRILLDGEDVTGLAPRALFRRGVGRTFQVAQTFSSMTVAENVQMALLSRRGETRQLLPRADRRHREEAMAVLALVGMADEADRAGAALAYGDVKRVELAVALASGPKLLLMDEPTAGMAPRERAALMGLVASLSREREIGVLFTEHDMAAVFAHADRVLVLVRGEIIAAGRPDEVRADPRVRKAYLGEADLAVAARGTA